MDKFVYFLLGNLIYVFVFFSLQWVWFNTRRVKQLIFTFSAIAFLSAFLVFIPFYFLTTEIYPDDVVRACVAFSAAYGSLGFSGIYIILGPISSDRSLSAHMCIQLMRNGGRMKESELMGRYNQDVIFTKRFNEYRDVDVMHRENGDLVLTKKGRRVALIFDFFLKFLNMKENF